jgi:adenylate cyclase
MDKPKIALIEDDKILLKVASEELREAGFEVWQALDGEEGWKLIQSKKPDLILLDIVMPKMDGITLLKMLKRDDYTKDVPVIVLTNLSDSNRVADAMELGARAYLVKSSQKLEGVVKKVREMLGS